MTEVVERRRLAAKARNQTFLVHFYKDDGDNGRLRFMDEYKTDWEMDVGVKWWHRHFGFFVEATEDLWPGEDKLTRTRRLRRNKKWETWR